METKRLIPYSVHLPKNIHDAIKNAAEGRKASGLVRDAITMYIEGKDLFVSGYNKGLRDSIKIIQDHESASSIAIHGRLLSDALTEAVEMKIGADHGTQKG